MKSLEIMLKFIAKFVTMQAIIDQPVSNLKFKPEEVSESSGTKSVKISRW